MLGYHFTIQKIFGHVVPISNTAENDNVYIAQPLTDMAAGGRKDANLIHFLGTHGSWELIKFLGYNLYLCFIEK